MSYKLRCAISAHAKDLRGLAIMDNCIITCSRDNTAKIWTEAGLTYEQSAVLCGHANFVSSVCAIPPSEAYELGLILTGGNDNVILGFVPYTSDPVISFVGHVSNVCVLAASTKNGMFLSGSWDNTARLWDVSSNRNLVTFYGHTQPVWAVIHMPENYIVTGSGDKNIKVFYPDGTCFRTLFGHTDCVRGLVYMNQGCFMSCANDGTLKKWSAQTGDCLETYNWEDNYIYCISAQDSLKVIAFGGESHNLTILEGIADESGEVKRQIVEIPSTNIWAVGVLPNSDVVAGSSDGYLRIFTKDPSRMASKELQAAYRDEVDASLAGASATPSGSQPQLPGREALKIPGTFEGEIKIIEDSGSHYCYEWKMDTKMWTILPGTCPPKSENYYEGKYYDFVFSVDVEDGKPALKLPFNKGDDPILVAQQFILEHNLPPDYLERIVAFLGENTGVSGAGPTPTQGATGEAVSTNSYYPPDSYVFFDNFDFAQVSKKLAEFMAKIGYTPAKIVDAQVQLERVSSEECPSNVAAVNLIIDAANNWPEDLVYPILDFARIAARSPPTHRLLLGEEYADRFYSSLQRFMTTETPICNRMFLFRILSNMFSQKEGEELIFKHQKELLKVLPSLMTQKHRAMEIALTTFIVNMSLGALKRNDYECLRSCLRFIRKVIALISEPEALFRVMVALGTIGVIEGSIILTPDILSTVKKVAAWDMNNAVTRKSALCATHILEDLQAKPGC